MIKVVSKNSKHICKKICYPNLCWLTWYNRNYTDAPGHAPYEALVWEKTLLKEIFSFSPFLSNYQDSEPYGLPHLVIRSKTSLSSLVFQTLTQCLSRLYKNYLIFWAPSRLWLLTPNEGNLHQWIVNWLRNKCFIMTLCEKLQFKQGASGGH